MLAHSSCSCRYSCLQCREDRSGSVSVHRALLQLKTSWWKLMLSTGLLLLPCSWFCFFSATFKGCTEWLLVWSLSLQGNNTKSYAGSGHGLSGLVSCPMRSSGFLGRCENKKRPHSWLWAQWASIPGCVAHWASQNVWLSTPCQILKFAVTRKRGKIRDGRSEIPEGNESWSVYTHYFPSWVSSGMLKPLVP